MLSDNAFSPSIQIRIKISIIRYSYNTNIVFCKSTFFNSRKLIDYIRVLQFIDFIKNNYYRYICLINKLKKILKILCIRTSHDFLCEIRDTFKKSLVDISHNW